MDPYGSQQPLLRAATPITPVHSPGHSIHSLSSVRSRTPGQLSLHEYRQQQATPSPPAVRGAKQVRRKAAAFGLNVIERVSSVPSTPRQALPRSFTSPHQSLAAEIPGALPVEQTQSLISTPSPSPSIILQQPHPQEQSGYQLEHPSSSEPERFYKPHERYDDFSKNFKPIKRLPRRSALDHTSSPLRSSTSSSAGGLTDSSTFSLSRFPHPPPFAEAVPPEASREPARQHQVTEAETPSTPTVLHYRGASFDVVNPHQSLLFSSIETPADRDAELSDYFHTTPSKVRLVSEAAMVLQAARDSDTPSVNSQGKSGPPRALYDDLSAAYQGIRAASLRNVQTKGAPMLDLPLPPRPAMLASASTEYSNLESGDDLENYRPQPLNATKPLASPSFMQRLSKAFRHRRRSSTTSVAHPAGDDRELLPIDEQHVSAYRPRPLALVSGVNQSAPIVSSELRRDVDATDHERRASLSEGDLAAAHGYYDLDSIYPSSNFMREDSVSVYDPRQSIPFGVRTGEIDYSSEVDTHSYIYEFVDSPRNSDRLSSSKLKDHVFQHKSAALAEPKDNTLASIYDQYQGDLSQASLRDLTDAEAEHEDAIRISGIDHLQGHIGDAKSPTSGLSQFDFGIDRASSSGSSSILSPRTPEQAVFPPAMARAFRARAGLPPNMPLPLQPHMSLAAPQPPFARRDFSDISDMHSHASSYGDTRDLLLLSQQQLTPSNPSQSRRFAPLVSPLSAVASSATLPEDDASKKLPKCYSAGDLSDVSDLSTTRSSLPLPERSRSAVDRAVKQDIKRLSQSSGVSRLSGNILIISSDVTPKNESPQASSADLPSDVEISFSENAPKRQTGGASQSTALLETSFKADHSGIPIMWRRISPVRAGGRENEPPGKDSVADMTEEGDEQDWETVADMSRPNLPAQASEDSMAEFSTFASLNSSQLVKVHPGDSRYQHEYKLQSPADSEEPVLLPSYDFRGGNGFPNRNALTPPRVASIPYRHASPLAESHIHPFGSSPTSLKATPLRNVQSMNWEDQRLTQSGNPDGYSPGSHSSSRSAAAATGLEGRQGFSISTTTFDVVPLSMLSGLLSSEPNDEILYDANEPMPFQCVVETTPRSAGLPSSSDRGFRQLNSSSSPFSERDDNSFAKLTYLGPKGNLTGTPRGTGMREVGSSLADSSTPGMNFSSTPCKPFVSSPLAQYRSSPISQYDAVDFAARDLAIVSGHATHGSKSSIYSKDSQEVPTSFLDLHLGHKQSLQNEGLLHVARKQSHEFRRGSSGRASVPSQTKLREMRLIRQPYTSSMNASDGTRPSRAARTEFGSLDLYSPLRPKIPGISHRNVYSGEEHLRPFGRPQSSICSDMRSEKQRLSWVIFLVLFWFPPFLVLYGFGKTDFLMVWFSKGEILHCGRFQKRVALWTGITMSVVLPVAVIVILVCYHFGLF